MPQLTNMKPDNGEKVKEPGNSAGDLFGIVKRDPFQWLFVTSNDQG